MTEFRPLVCTGVDTSLVVPLPTWPKKLFPQPQTVPSTLSAMLWTSPPMMAVTELRKPAFPTSWTSIGISTRVRLDWERPTPNLPPKVAPHVQTVPSDLRTTVPRAPPQMDTTSAAPNAMTGNVNISAQRIVCALRFIGADILSDQSRISHFSLATLQMLQTLRFSFEGAVEEGVEFEGGLGLQMVHERR